MNNRMLPVWAFVLNLALVASADAHDGPDPVGHWIFNARTVKSVEGEETGLLKARLGPDGKITGDVELVDDPLGQSLHLAGQEAQVVLAEDFNDVALHLPSGPFTVSAWCSVETRKQWGSLICAIQDNGAAEKGWVLGYNQRNFYFGLATKGADDGDGMMTYLAGETDYEMGRLYHVVATYDGKEMQLFVNGQLDGSSKDQNGAILYPDQAPLVIGAYRDANEFHPHHGLIRDIAVYNLAAKPKWVKQEFELQERLAKMPGSSTAELKFVVKPYLQMATKESIIVSWETSRPATTDVKFGEDEKLSGHQTGNPEKLVHHVELTGLRENTQYFYQAGSASSDGQKIASDTFTFQTACDESTPYAFAVISDTQGNPKVSGPIAKMAWEQRPSFLIHPGDLVSTGTNDSHWTQHFFASMHPLISRVPMYPVLGNHEMNARNYYDYMMLPSPEYFYQFQYGNAHFFMIDSNKKVDPESEQYKWLDEALASSNSQWKFVVHHHPPYSSDENDYGNLWKTNKSTRGDARVRQITRLYDKHGVDIVFNGHIHSYERTWPVRNGKPVLLTKANRNAGTIYMITGGGGGSLETPGPYRPPFQNNVKRGHHYVMVHVNGGQLELKSFDLEGRLFDYIKLDQPNMEPQEQ